MINNDAIYTWMRYALHRADEKYKSDRIQQANIAKSLPRYSNKCLNMLLCSELRINIAI